MRFTYDPNKDAANIEKHGLSLADAPLVFDAASKLTLESAQNNEARCIDIALVEVAGAGAGVRFV